MGRPRQFDSDDVVERSMRAFWEHGYGDTSVGDLVEATGLRPGSLYNAFQGGKHELFLGALERYSKLVVPAKMGALEAPDAPWPRSGRTSTGWSATCAVRRAGWAA